MATKALDSFSTYQYGEGRTGIGQLVEFSCASGRIDAVKQFLLENVRTIHPPVTKRSATEHAWYVGYSRYDLKQHKYAGGKGGYIEVLEVSNPPDDRCGFIVYEYSSYLEHPSSFSEWRTLKQAIAAFERYFCGGKAREELPNMPGFKRKVVCEIMTPWFYAIGDEELVGDYVFPHGIQDDAVYKFGRKFVVYDYAGLPSIKTCMGTRFVQKKTEYRPYSEVQYRIVYWDDGSAWKESESARANTYPRPIEDGEVWIAEAVSQFRELLAGSRTEFSIKFIDGNQFVGKLSQLKRKGPCAEGEYLLMVNIKGKSEPVEGWLKFKPSPEAPDIVQHVTREYAKRGHAVERVEVKQSKDVQGKKWCGVFHAPSDPVENSE